MEIKQFKSIITSAGLAMKLIELGVLPPRCKSATIRLEANRPVTIEAEYFATTDILDAPWEEIGIDIANGPDFTAKVQVRETTALDSHVRTYEPVA